MEQEPNQLETDRSAFRPDRRSGDWQVLPLSAVLYMRAYRLRESVP